MFFIGDQLCSHGRALADALTAVCLAMSNLESSVLLDSDACMQQNYQQRFITIAVLVPLVARALQCIRRFVDVRVIQGIGGPPAFNHLLNCFKYCMGILVASMHSNLHAGDSAGSGIAWYMLACISVAYAFCWDVSRDWGLGCNACDMKHGGLRGDLLFVPHWSPSGGLYYMAAGFNLIARCSGLIAAAAFPAAWKDATMLVLGLIEVDMCRVAPFYSIR